MIKARPAERNAKRNMNTGTRMLLTAWIKIIGGGREQNDRRQPLAERCAEGAEAARRFRSRVVEGGAPSGGGGGSAEFPVRVEGGKRRGRGEFCPHGVFCSSCSRAVSVRMVARRALRRVCRGRCNLLRQTRRIARRALDNSGGREARPYLSPVVRRRMSRQRSGV